ncbi:phosphatase PAP2 family protein [Methylobacterium sp. J-072]|uniref:phosphatase PAP2 family protein n=1 Tax=Methylobacterium sp. J-072 TaxID=2836651 RepID=UPI001FBA52A6|nr:phosphatase PAP2 family protein [Methylobacterium sp. J-072]MCJ2095836.1 phosphatase PAP2 family protein [Methylobacterium sp. J-072]
MHPLSRALLALVWAALPLAPLAAAELHATWIDPEALALQRVLPPTPAPGSAAEAADLAAVRAAVAARTTEDERRITANLPCTLDRFADVLGPAFTAARMPKLAALIEHVFQDGELAVLAAKSAIGRKRPYTLDPDLRTFGHRSGSTSYPSGHATFGYLAATVLGILAPEKREALFARADQYGRNRFEAGTHFPSDLEAGTIAAAIIAEALLRDGGFQQALADARAEVDRAGR